MYIKDQEISTSTSVALLISVRRVVSTSNENLHAAKRAAHTLALLLDHFPFYTCEAVGISSHVGRN